MLATTAVDIEERARDRVRAADGPDADVAHELDEAAGHAAASAGPSRQRPSSPSAAASFTVNDPAASRRRRLRAAGHYRLAGDGERAGGLLEQLLEEVLRASNAPTSW